MAHRQLHPHQVNDRTGELYLRLPAPLDNFILTPPREEDAAELVKVMNDPAVYNWLANPPFPYLLEHGQWWIDRATAEWEGRVNELKSFDAEDLKLVGGCLVDTIREVKEDGSGDVFVGNLGIRRCSWMEYCEGATVDDKARLEEANNRLPLGDPTIVWSLGYFLVPRYHRRGIMPAAIRTLLEEWAIPRMGVRRMLVTAFEGNYGSVRSMEKCGFKMRETREKCTVVRGETKGMHVLEWMYKEEDRT